MRRHTDNSYIKSIIFSKLLVYKTKKIEQPFMDGKETKHTAATLPSSKISEKVFN